MVNSNIEKIRLSLSGALIGIAIMQIAHSNSIIDGIIGFILAFFVINV